jgi:hypothetical protein
MRQVLLNIEQMATAQNYAMLPKMRPGIAAGAPIA